MARAAAALLLLALAGAAQARPLDRLRCASGVVPPVSGLTIQPVNGGLDLSWTAVPCASHYLCVVDRSDIQGDNTLKFNVTGTGANVRNVANSSPYSVQVHACSAAGCSAAVTGSGIPTPVSQSPPVVVAALPTPAERTVFGYKVVTLQNNGSRHLDSKFRPY